MKRSEMIEHLTQIIRINAGRSRDDVVADFILKFIEEKGMLPPKAKVQPNRDHPGMTTNPDYYGFWEYVNEWEPEDEV